MRSPGRGDKRIGTAAGGQRVVVNDAQLATQMVRKTPRNLQDVPSAYDIKPE